MSVLRATIYAPRRRVTPLLYRQFMTCGRLLHESKKIA